MRQRPTNLTCTRPGLGTVRAGWVLPRKRTAGSPGGDGGGAAEPPTRNIRVHRLADLLDLPLVRPRRPSPPVSPLAAVTLRSLVLVRWPGSWLRGVGL